MLQRVKELVKQLPYYGKITTKGRYTGVKAKAWAIVSDFVRMRDFIKYGKCVSCNKAIFDWHDGDAGHFISMGGHGALIGFHTDNIALQCKYCNQQSSFHLGVTFEDNLRKRKINVNALRNIATQTIKADDFYFLGVIKATYAAFLQLKEQYPDYTYPKYLWENQSARNSLKS